MKKETIKLFKSLLVRDKRVKEVKDDICKKTIPLGFVFSREVMANFDDDELIKLISIVKKELLITGRQANNSFHKSWAKVRDSPIELLYLEQIIHYITTYGYELLGIEGDIFIPKEKLSVVKIDEDFKLMVIHGINETELKDKIQSLLNGIALKEETINDLMNLSIYINVDKVKNKEVMCRLCDKLNILPNNPTEFLRFLVYKATNSTLLIKNEKVISAIKEKNFKKYLMQYDNIKLSSIFNRFKPLFLAMKNKNTKSIINKIRRLANKHHKPIQEDYLNNLTSCKRIDYDKVQEELDRVNIWRKIRLLYALHYRMQNPKSIMYKVRNGKSFSTKFNTTKDYKKSYEFVLNNIQNSLKDIKGKKIYIPDSVNYTLPSSEKQFIGNFPCGTSFEVEDDLLIGVHWKNVKHERIDLDLKMVGINNSIGWDASYRGDNTFFSGDMTDASGPNGASELFYIREIKDIYILTLNYYNHSEYKNINVPFKIMIGHEKVENMRGNHMINPNNIIATIPCEIDVKQKMLGMVKDKKYYMIDTNLGNSMSSSNKPYIAQAREYMISFYEKAISLNDLLLNAGAIRVNEVENADIDFSVENISKEIIIKILDN